MPAIFDGEVLLLAPMMADPKPIGPPFDVSGVRPVLLRYTRLFAASALAKAVRSHAT
ncbi:MAG: hypothetical protein WKF96_19090 [Solirubrobacteraceae bacterium]